MAWSYRLRYIRCGKKGCTVCAEEPAHGPYWYAYAREGGRFRHRYVGRTREVEDAFHERPIPPPPPKDKRFEFHGKMDKRIAYRIFALTNRPPTREITTMWRKLVWDNHPDRGGDTRVCAAINAAYEFLKKNPYL